MKGSITLLTELIDSNIWTDCLVCTPKSIKYTKYVQHHVLQGIPHVLFFSKPLEDPNQQSIDPTN